MKKLYISLICVTLLCVIIFYKPIGKIIAFRNKEYIAKIRVSIIDASGINDCEKYVIQGLKKYGFNILNYDKAKDTIEITVIMDRVSPDKSKAKLVRLALGQGEVSFEPHPLRLVDVSIILGKDFNIKKIGETKNKG